MSEPGLNLDLAELSRRQQEADAADVFVEADTENKRILIQFRRGGSPVQFQLTPRAARALSQALEEEVATLERGR